MTERYRRRNFGNLDLEVTLSDPAVYARPWTVAVRAELAADTEMIEWVCNEKSSEVQHWVGKASDEEKSEVKVAPEVLAKYVGTYVEQPQAVETGPARTSKSRCRAGRFSPTWTEEGKCRWRRSRIRSFSGLYGLGVEFRPGELLCEARIRRLPVRTQEIIYRGAVSVRSQRVLVKKCSATSSTMPRDSSRPSRWSAHRRTNRSPAACPPHSCWARIPNSGCRENCRGYRPGRITCPAARSLRRRAHGGRTSRVRSRR